jgi:hypothetical protein
MFDDALAETALGSLGLGNSEWQTAHSNPTVSERCNASILEIVFHQRKTLQKHIHEVMRAGTRGFSEQNERRLRTTHRRQEHCKIRIGRKDHPPLFAC